MPTPLSRRPAAATARLAAAALVAAAGFAGLVACGGGGDGLVIDDVPATPPSAQRADAARRPGEPADREARTTSAGYISRLAAEEVDQALGGHVVWIDAGCCAGHPSTLPRDFVYALQAAFGDDAPIFVFGSDLRQAARLADQLHALGLRQTRLVTP